MNILRGVKVLKVKTWKSEWIEEQGKKIFIAWM